jgi:flagellar protein FliS
MDHRAAADAYRSASVENAPPIKVVRMLYAGALRFLEQTAEEDPASPQSRFNEFVSRADSIIAELRLALDHEQNPEVSENLEGLYLFAEKRLGDAILDRDREPLNDVKYVLTTLLDAWNEVEIQTTRVA